MKIRLAEDADQERWDEFILSHPKASPYHLFAWKKAIEAAYEHKCIYFYAEKNREILGVLPLVGANESNWLQCGRNCRWGWLILLVPIFVNILVYRQDYQGR